MRFILIISLFISYVANCQIVADTSVFIQNNGDTTKVVVLRNAATSTSTTPTRLKDSMAVARTLISTKQNTIGYTPYNATNPNNYISSITSQNVTTALGFTPYNATNPSGYISAVPAQTFASLTGKPTTLLGYGITDAYPLAGNPSNFLTAVPAQTFASLTSKPTTLNGYGITDGVANTRTVNGQPLSADVTVTTVSGNAGGLSSPLSFANGGIGSGAATSATSGTMTVSMTTEMITITPTNACTFNASGGVTGQRVTFVITTSGVSSFTLTWNTNFRTTGTLATGTTTAKIFCVTFLYNGSLWLETNRTAAM